MWQLFSRSSSESLEVVSSIMTSVEEYRKVASSNTSCLEAHADFFQIAYEGDFRSLCTVTF